MTKVRVATVWFSGCAGCHMSFLDLDELMIDLADRIEIVKSPVVDTKEFPANVDVTLIEGAIGNEEHVELVREIRKRSKIVIALGDCAVTGNVPAMRNGIPVNELLEEVYGKERTTTGTIPNEVVPRLEDRVCPVHEVIPVDYFLHGCPPPAAVIGKALLALLDGKVPELTGRELKFG
ncbi:oxidoreductase [Candidatus Bipolaricaulota bacterium]|nr:oxidoreductase [Candidatus Bipolaricaulota bacterium]HHR86275.1 oxidoreductase [Candidatus Acetothermia bacterium]